MKPEKEKKRKQQQTSNKIITQAYQSRFCSSWKLSSKVSFSILLHIKRGEHDAIRNRISNDFNKRRIPQPKTQ